MVTLEESLCNIKNKLQTLLLSLRKICVSQINDMAIQIDKIIVGTDKLPRYIKDDISYELTADDLKDVTRIEQYAFEGHKSLINVTIPESVTEIGYWAFGACYNLTNIIISNGVKSIFSGAFEGCESLSNINIPESVTYMGDNVFNSCSNLTDIYLHASTPPTLEGTYGIISTITIHVPVGSGDAYKSATNWSSLADQIVEDIEP